jgi:hypothetical protein
MPKDEFDWEDPLALTGVALPTSEDTTDVMAECFVEEFMRMGYPADRILALFRRPDYFGPRRVLDQRGEAFVRGVIAETFARWGRQMCWSDSTVGTPNPT